MHAVLIHNPSAGGEKDSRPDDLIRLLKEADFEVEIPEHGGDKTVERVRQGADLLIVAGGDGTVTKVALNAPSGSTIGILPMGTANNIANSLGIRGKPADIIKRWPAAEQKTIDIWQARGPWGEQNFIEGCGLGALTRAAHHMDDHAITGHSPEHEISVARAALMKTLGDSKPVPARLTIDGEPLQGDFLMLEMLNFSAVGPRLPLAWSADPTDGLLEIGYAMADRYNDLYEWLSRGAAPWSDAPITLRRARSVELTWRDARFRIGDDYWPETGAPEPQATHQASLRLARSGPRVLVPRATPREQ